MALVPSAGAAEALFTPDCTTDNLLARKAPAQRQDLRGNFWLVTDEAVAPEGAQWDSPVAIVLDTPAGSVTYDLGQPTSLTAFFVQADANDTYKIFGSLDGTPGSFKMLAEVEQNGSSLLEAERSLLGFDHANAGGHLLAHWKFPANLVAAVWFHHKPSLAKPHQRLASYVYLGNLIAHFMGHGYGHHALAMKGRSEVLDILDIPVDRLPHYMIKTMEQIEAVRAIFGMKN